MLISTTLLIGLIPDAINLFFIKSGLSFIVTFSTLFAKNIVQFSVLTSTLKFLLISSEFSACDKSISLTFLSYIAAISFAIPKMLNKSPLFAVKSKSITSSSNFITLIGSSPIFAVSGNS